MRCLKLLPAVLLAIFAATTQAAVYKWVDDKGQVHYGARPPSSIQAEEMRIRNNPASPRSQQESTSEGEQTAPAEPEGGRQTQAVDDAERRAALEENCKIAQGNIDVLRDPSNRRFRDPDGNVAYYTDEQREERIAQAQSYLDENCKDILP